MLQCDLSPPSGFARLDAPGGGRLMVRCDAVVLVTEWRCGGEPRCTLRLAGGPPAGVDVVGELADVTWRLEE